jgi:hypothetical protein
LLLLVGIRVKTKRDYFIFAKDKKQVKVGKFSEQFAKENYEED